MTRYLYALSAAHTNVDDPIIISLWEDRNDAIDAEKRATANGYQYTNIEEVAVNKDELWDLGDVL
jgi:hypothetical protein